MLLSIDRAFADQNPPTLVQRVDRGAHTGTGTATGALRVRVPIVFRLTFPRIQS